MGGGGGLKGLKAHEVVVTFDSKPNAFILDQDREQKFVDGIQVIFTIIEAQDRKF